MGVGADFVNCAFFNRKPQSYKIAIRGYVEAIRFAARAGSHRGCIHLLKRAGVDANWLATYNFVSLVIRL